MSCTEAVRGRRRLPGGRRRSLRAVGSRSWGLECRPMPMPSRQRVARRSVPSMAVGFRVGKVARTGTVDAGQPRVADSEVERGTTVERTARVVTLLSHKSRESITRSWTTVRCRYRTARPRVLIAHYSTRPTVK